LYTAQHRIHPRRDRCHSRDRSIATHALTRKGETRRGPSLLASNTGLVCVFLHTIQQRIIPITHTHTAFQRTHICDDNDDDEQRDVYHSTGSALAVGIYITALTTWHRKRSHPGPSLALNSTLSLGPFDVKSLHLQLPSPTPISRSPHSLSPLCSPRSHASPSPLSHSTDPSPNPPGQSSHGPTSHPS
jgi:hypothetical protein